MQSSKTTAYIQLLKYWLIAPLLSKESAISDKESAKKYPYALVGVNFLRRRPCGIHGFGLDMLFSSIGFNAIYANSVPIDFYFLKS